MLRLTFGALLLGILPLAGQASDCDQNYGGVCVPVASDVDCAGGSGNGPAYVAGPVQVVGRDIYDLDRDKDGIGCERD
jgi:resuscitation-promoting factor RpfB